MDAQTDLSLHWKPISEGAFSPVIAHLYDLCKILSFVVIAVGGDYAVGFRLYQCFVTKFTFV